jgi:hypothetical protein
MFYPNPIKQKETKIAKGGLKLLDEKGLVIETGQNDNQCDSIQSKMLTSHGSGGPNAGTGPNHETR